MGALLLMDLMFGLVILAPFVFLAQVGIAQFVFPGVSYPSLNIHSDDDESLAHRELGFLVVFFLQVVTVLFALDHVR